MNANTDFSPEIPPLASTGVPGLDCLLQGGFPRGEMHLVQGTAGTGKTSIALSYLCAGAKKGESGLYITLSQSRAHLERIAKSHSWSLDGIAIHELTPRTLAETMADRQTVLASQDVELQEVFRGLVSVVDRLKPRRAVVDSITIIQILAGGTQRYHNEVVLLRQLFTERDCTTIFLADHPAEIEQGSQPEVLFHPLSGCVIHLEQESRPYGDSRRRLRIVKSRGIRSAGGYHDFRIRTGQVEVFPRLGAYTREEHGLHPLRASGIETLDSVLGGGLEAGTAALIVGPSGTGKSTLACAFASAAVAAGAHAAVYLFDERPESIKARSERLGLPLRRQIDSGRLLLRQLDPAEIAPGEFAQDVRQTVDAHGTKVVVLDSLAGYFNAVGRSDLFVAQLHELLTYLSRTGVLTILAGSQEGFMSIGKQQGVDISYLSDTILVLGYYESDGHLHRCIAPAKKRGGGHDTAIRELIISDGSVRLGEPLSQFRNIYLPNADPASRSSPAGEGARTYDNRP